MIHLNIILFQKKIVWKCLFIPQAFFLPSEFWRQLICFFTDDLVVFSFVLQFPCFLLGMTSIRRMCLDYHPGLDTVSAKLFLLLRSIFPSPYDYIWAHSFLVHFDRNILVVAMRCSGLIFLRLFESRCQWKLSYS